MALSFGEGSREHQRSLNQPVTFESPADFVLGSEQRHIGRAEVSVCS